MSELRYDLIQGRWVIIATDRSRRPHDLEVATSFGENDEYCPFCPGNERRTPTEIAAVGRPEDAPANGPGWRLRVIPNKYPALSVDGDLERRGQGLYDRMRGVGAHEVIIDSDEHRADFATLNRNHLTDWVVLGQSRLRDLYHDRRLQYALLFKNQGGVAGATLAHPHSQIIATPIIPRIVVQELQQAQGHFQRKKRCLFCDVLDQELAAEERLVFANDHFVAFCPYASRFPFEVMIVPRHHRHRFTDVSEPEARLLAEVLQEVCRRLEGVLKAPPYNLVVHTAPNTEAFGTPGNYWQTLMDDYHWHIELLPRLTRVAGFETGTDFFVNPTAPEEAARFLREGADGIA